VDDRFMSNYSTLNQSLRPAAISEDFSWDAFISKKLKLLLAPGQQKMVMGNQFRCRELLWRKI